MEKIDDDDLAYIYLAKQNVSHMKPVVEDSKSKKFFLNDYMILNCPQDKDDLSFQIFAFDKDGLHEEINVNQENTMIDFYLYGKEEKRELFYACYDNCSDSWYIRIKKENANIPTSLKNALDIDEEGKIETLKIIECCKEIYEENKKNKLNKYQKSL